MKRWRMRCHSGWADFPRFADLFIRPAWSVFARIGFEQNAGMDESARWGLPSRNQLLQEVRVRLREDDAVLFHQPPLYSTV